MGSLLNALGSFLSAGSGCGFGFSWVGGECGLGSSRVDSRGSRLLAEEGCGFDGCGLALSLVAEEERPGAAVEPSSIRLLLLCIR